MLKRTEGLVLRNISFGEADLIVTYLTSDFGIIKLFAKSPRKIKSKFGSSLEPLTHTRISFWGKEDANLPKIIQSDIIHPFHDIRDNLRCFIKISELIELTLNFIPERDVNKKVFYLFLNTMKTIEQNLTKCISGEKNTSNKYIKEEIDYIEDLIINYYKIKFLKYIGFSPNLDSCGRCGKKGDCFYVSSGSILCETCSKGINSPIRLTLPLIRLYNDLLTWEHKKIKRIKPSKRLICDLSNVLKLHIQYILSKPLKTETFISSLSHNVK